MAKRSSLLTTLTANCQLPTANWQPETDSISNETLTLLMQPSNTTCSIIRGQRNAIPLCTSCETGYASGITIMETVCANCGIRIEWQPTVIDRRTYCCLGCAIGGPCTCDYSNLPRLGEFRAIIRSTQVIILPAPKGERESHVPRARAVEPGPREARQRSADTERKPAQR